MTYSTTLKKTKMVAFDLLLSTSKQNKNKYANNVMLGYRKMSVEEKLRIKQEKFYSMLRM